MELTALTAISPIDGRYRNHVQHLDDYFSEFALIKYRVLVEVEYFLFLSDARAGQNEKDKINSPFFVCHIQLISVLIK